jgi:hypothetical protein
MTKSPKAPVQRTVRCVIYTRKSTEEGLEQEFNSLHAQRESAEAYIKSQKQAGWAPSGLRSRQPFLAWSRSKCLINSFIDPAGD